MPRTAKRLRDAVTVLHPQLPILAARAAGQSHRLQPWPHTYGMGDKVAHAAEQG
jgi:hypothetical protein